MKNKGFTLVELIVVIAILGLITIMTVPSVVKLEENNAKRNFEYYGDSLTEGAKIYIDKYKEDLVWTSRSGYTYTYVDYDTLKSYDYVKAYNNRKYDCNTTSARVYVLRCNNNTYKYHYTLSCTKKNGGGVIYNNTFSLPTTCK